MQRIDRSCTSGKHQSEEDGRLKKSPKEHAVERGPVSSCNQSSEWCGLGRDPRKDKTEERIGDVNGQAKLSGSNWPRHGKYNWSENESRQIAAKCRYGYPPLKWPDFLTPVDP